MGNFIENPNSHVLIPIKSRKHCLRCCPSIPQPTLWDKQRAVPGSFPVHIHRLSVARAPAHDVDSLIREVCPTLTLYGQKWNSTVQPWCNLIGQCVQRMTAVLTSQDFNPPLSQDYSDNNCCRTQYLILPIPGKPGKCLPKSIC